MSNFKPINRQTFVNQENMHPRMHAKFLDKELGYRIPKIEEKLLKKFSAYDKAVDISNKKQHYQGTETWIGLHPQILQTPYCDIYKALELLSDKDIRHVVDIGAGYGRVGLVLSVLMPEAQFTGYEIVKQRRSEASRIFTKLKLKNSAIELQNVLEDSFEIPEADVFFIYDFSEREDVNIILRKMLERMRNREFYLITKGDRVDYLMKYIFNNEWIKFSNVGDTGLKIYKSANAI